VADGGFVAYQVFGEGPQHLLFVPSWLQNLDVMWEEPSLAAYLDRLASFARVVCLDKRGSGVSDPVPLASVPTIETWMDDAIAVMDTAGVVSAAVLGDTEGGPMAAVLAASHPERVTALVHVWVTQLDVRSVLPSIRVPTLVLHRTDARFHRVEHGRYLAEHIPGARLVELPGFDTSPFNAGDFGPLLDEVEQFLTGRVSQPILSRQLATILVTDVVGSTRRAADLGDRAWAEVIGAHDEIVRELVREYRGVYVDSTGDGALALFDGPARAVTCAARLAERLREQLGLPIRAGLHTGEVERVDAEVRGVAVHLAARVMAAAGGGGVLVSGTVKDLVVGSGIEFAERGVHELKGVPGEWALFEVVSAPQ
jgi:class 3 adenylate cyclase